MRSERQTERLALGLVFIALLLATARAWTTEDLDVIWTIPDSSLEGFGFALASGDVNGDGVPDILVAADTFDSTHGTTSRRGIVSIYLGDHIGDSTPDLRLRGPVWKGSNAPSLACGDLNGDGYADVVMGEDGAERGFGMCSVFMGGDPIDTTPAFVLHGLVHFGCDVSIGDVNGDGYSDLAVGAYYRYQGKGIVSVFYGGATFDTIPDVVLIGGHDGDAEGFGMGVTAEGDFDHDLYIGAWQYNPDTRGRMYVYFGGNPMDTSYDMAMSGEGVGHFLGFERPGALNALGVFDHAVEGNELWPHGAGSPGANCGKVYVHQGGRPMDSIPDVELIGRLDTAELGYSAQSAGDVTGDGNDDLLAGAPYLPPGGSGAAYLWETGNHFDTVPEAWIMGEVYRRMGERVRTAGDLDGDGRCEFIVSSYTDIPPARVWVCKYTGSGVQEEEAVGVRARSLRVWPSVVSREVNLAGCEAAILMDASGRKVLDLKVGANDVLGLAPGVYFAREEPQASGSKPQVDRKIVVTR